MRYSVAKCQRKERFAIAFLYKWLKLIRKKKSAFPILYKSRVMTNILDKFSLSLILRQFFCGVVFFIPSILVLTPGCTIFEKMEGVTSSVALTITILALIVGIIIYHLEKNTYSYLLQSIFFIICKFVSAGKTATKKMKMFMACLRGVCVLVFFSLVSSLLIWWLELPWMCICYAACFALVYLLLICMPMISFYRRVWSVGAEILAFHDNKSQLIMNHLDTWSDNIHCIQCCCFAWLLGVTIINMLVSGCYVSIPCKCGVVCEIINEDWAVALKSTTCQFVWGLLLVEILFEFHRFCHLFKIAEEK